MYSYMFCTSELLIGFTAKTMFLSGQYNGQSMSGEGKNKARSILLIAVAVGLCYTCHRTLLLDVDANVNDSNIDATVASKHVPYKQEVSLLPLEIYFVKNRILQMS